MSVGLLDLANTNTLNVWDILIKKNDSLTEIQIQLGILYLIFQTYLGGCVNGTSFIKLGIGGSTVVGGGGEEDEEFTFIYVEFKVSKGYS